MGDEICYLCRRNNEDLKHALNERFKKIDNDKKSLKNQKNEVINTFRETFNTILKSTQGNKYLDFKVSTIVGSEVGLQKGGGWGYGDNDYDEFRRKIPNLDEILEYKTSDDQTIADILLRIKDFSKMTDNELCEHESEELEVLQNSLPVWGEIEAIKNDEKKLEWHNCYVHHTNISLCPICHSLLSATAEHPDGVGLSWDEKLRKKD
ncbi:hypothetical protein BMS3Bbin16_00372 [archaeon BMS3Bbin16]|nr:hypothetical protein BMS3Bbin16_00372 [archaeon BMS3Bbin16]